MFYRVLLLSILLIQLSACGTQKLRFVKAEKKIVDKELATINKRTTPALEQMELIVPVLEIKTEEIQYFPSVTNVKEREIVITPKFLQPEPTDSTKTVTRDDYKLHQALDTERKAKTSKGLAIAGIILAFFFFPVGLILSIGSWLLYQKAKRARYNTQVGEMHLDGAKTAVIINAILYALILLGLIIVFLALVFF